MTRKKASDTEAADAPSTLDRLTALRREINGETAVTALIDILIDDQGGDSAELAGERASETAESTTTDGEV